MPWCNVRVLSMLIAAALWCHPSLAHAFAFDASGDGHLLLNQTAGTPALWAPPHVTMSVHLGNLPPGVTLANGTTSWDANAEDALAIWNTVVPSFFTFDTTEHNPCDQQDAFNTMAFSPDNCGDGFGDAIALTRKIYAQHNGIFFLTHADVLVNANICWNAYAGPLRNCPDKTLRYEVDLHRVALHELGHVLGLEHPDDAGQTVPALMNRYISDLDTLMSDDRTGAAFLYPQAPVAASSNASSAGGGGGGCTLRPDSGVDPTLGVLLLLLVIVLTWKHARRLHRSRSAQRGLDHMKVTARQSP